MKKALTLGLSLLFASALAIAQVPNPATPGVLGGFDKYQNNYPVQGGQYFSPGSWSYLNNCFSNSNTPTATISIATPGVITVSNSCAAGQAVQFQTTSALPTGLTAGTTYYVISTGLTGTSFEVSTSVGGSAVNTSGTQSGTQTIYPVYTNATTSFTGAISLAPVPPGFSVPGHCTLFWQSSNTSGTLTLAMQPNNTTSTLYVLNTAHTGSSGGTLADVSTTISNSSSATAISGTMTAGTANTTYRDDVYFNLVSSPAGTTPTTLTLSGESSSTSYTISLQPGSFCVVGS